MTARTAAVVLNYRTPADTILAVRSLQASDSPIAPIVLVDNGSDDESIALFQRHLSGIDLVQLPRNEGFSDGCNAGIRRALDADAERILLLNSDVIVPPGTVRALHRVLDADSGIGIVSPVLRRRNNPDLIESLGISYHRASGRMRLLGHDSPAAEIAAFDCRVVDGVCGCVMLVRSEVFAAVGLLRSEYFFGFEDLDFCCRAREQGLLSACAGATFVLHEGRQSIGRRSALRAYFATRNHLLLASRFPARSSRVARALRLANVLALNLVHTVAAADIPTISGLVAAVRGARDFAAGRLGNAPSARRQATVPSTDSAPRSPGPIPRRSPDRRP